MTDRGPAMEYVPAAQHHTLTEEQRRHAVHTAKFSVPARAVVAEEQAAIEEVTWMFYG
jgi:hypothetical protein